MHVYQFIFLGRGSIAFTRFSKRKCVPLCHSHTPRLGPSCPHSHEYRQTSAADQPEHVPGGVCAVRVRLQIHGSWGQSMQEPQYLPIEPGTEGQRPPPPPGWRVSYHLLSARDELFCVSNLFPPGRTSKAGTAAAPPARTDT